MKRRAMIIYCDNTPSGELYGPPQDKINYCNFLQNNLGGKWDSNEILPLPNPTSVEVLKEKNIFFKGADYSFIIFTGHGFLNIDDRNRQYVELLNDNIPITNLITTAKRQTMIIDACRGYYSPTKEMLKGLTESFEYFSGDPFSTREIFDRAVLRAEEGLTVLYAASKNQTALDTDNGAAYLLSLLRIAELWEDNDKKSNILDLKVTHDFAAKYVKTHFDTIQIPTMNREKRLRHFPFAVKVTSLNDNINSW